MAGLQYNFFPTDLLYPLQKTNKNINTSQQNSLFIKTKKNSDNEILDDSKSYNKFTSSTNNNNNILKANSSVALAPITKHEENQDYDQNQDF
uniref:Putative ovule protein n=1 Tax=Solanum chacoense TaxID=4108 RepID=A0A0V0H2V9_SOLCH